MSYVMSNIPHFKCWVRREFTHNHDQYHGEFIHAMAIAVATIPDRCLSFHLVFTGAESDLDDLFMHWVEVEDNLDGSELGFSNSTSSSEVLFDSSSEVLFDSSASDYERSNDNSDSDSDDVATSLASTADIWLPLEHVSSASPLPVACTNGIQSDSVHDGPKRRLEGTGENSDVHLDKKICQGASIGSPNFTTDVGSRPKVQINAVRNIPQPPCLIPCAP